MVLASALFLSVAGSVKQAHVVLPFVLHIVVFLCGRYNTRHHELCFAFHLVPQLFSCKMSLLRKKCPDFILSMAYCASLSLCYVGKH